MKWFIEHLSVLPTTNFRIFSGIVQSWLYIIVCLVGITAGWINDVNIYPIIVVGGFILAQEGLDVTQFIQKRKTTDVSMLGQTRESIVPAPAQPAAADPPINHVTTVKKDGDKITTTTPVEPSAPPDAEVAVPRVRDD